MKWNEASFKAMARRRDRIEEELCARMERRECERPSALTMFLLCELSALEDGLEELETEREWLEANQEAVI